MRALKNESFLSSRGVQRKALLVFQLFFVAIFLNSTFIITNQINSMLQKDLRFQYNKGVFLSLDQTLIKKWETLKASLLLSPEIESISFSDGLFGEGFTNSPRNCNDKSSFKVYSAITFLIALLGIFGLFLFTIRKKVKEVSIRKLFGASLKDTFVLLMKEQFVIAAISNIVAIPITYYVMNKWLNNFQFREEIGITVFLKTYIMTVIFTFLTIFLLIIRTHKINLIESLRSE